MLEDFHTTPIVLPWTQNHKYIKCSKYNIIKISKRKKEERAKEEGREQRGTREETIFLIRSGLSRHFPNAQNAKK